MGFEEFREFREFEEFGEFKGFIGMDLKSLLVKYFIANKLTTLKQYFKLNLLKIIN